MYFVLKEKQLFRQVNQKNRPDRQFLDYKRTLMSVASTLFDIRPVLKNEDSQLKVVLAADDSCHSLHKLAPWAPRFIQVGWKKYIAATHFLQAPYIHDLKDMVLRRIW